MPVCAHVSHREREREHVTQAIVLTSHLRLLQYPHHYHSPYMSVYVIIHPYPISGVISDAYHMCLFVCVYAHYADCSSSCKFVCDCVPPVHVEVQRCEDKARCRSRGALAGLLPGTG